MVAVEDEVEEIKVELPEPAIKEIDIMSDSLPSESSFGDLGEDLFNKSAAEVKNLAGLKPGFKRKISRSMEKVLAGVDGAHSQQLIPPLVVGNAYSQFEVAIPPYNIDYLARIYEANEANFAAINAKVANIIGLGFDWKESAKTQETLERTDDQDKVNRMRRRLQHAKNQLNDWVETLNQEDTFLETLMKVYTDVEATGNGYLEVGRTTTGSIGYVGHIPSISIRVRIKRDGFVQIISNRAVFFRNYGDLNTPDPFVGDPRPNEIIHLKKYTPTDSFYGIPDIIAAKNALAGSEFASRYNLDYFEHKAVPRYIITLKGATLSPASEQKVVNFFRGSVKGKNHRTLYIPLPAGTKDSPVEFEMNAVEAGKQDSSFSDYDTQNINKILMAHRVPITKVSVADAAALAAAADADQTFKETVCAPAQDVFEKKVGKIFKEVTDAFDFVLNELTLTGEADQSKIDQVYLTTGVTVPNEIRARQGKPGLPGGDVIIPAAKKAPPAASKQIGQPPNPAESRNQQRAANTADSTNSPRAPKGEGRQQA